MPDVFKKLASFTALTIWLVIVFAFQAGAQTITVKSIRKPGDFTLIEKVAGKPETLMTSKIDPPGKFAGSNGVISIEAEHFTKKNDRGNTG